MTFTALSIHQPHAELIARGIKTIETRTWATSYRGPLLVCSTKRDALEVAAGADDFTLAALADLGTSLAELPLGVAVATVDVLDCRPMTREDQRAACCEVYPRAMAWVLGNVQRVQPFVVRGRPGLFTFDRPIPLAR